MNEDNPLSVIVHIDVYSVNALRYAPLFDFTREDLQRNERALAQNKYMGTPETAVWFIPPFNNPHHGTAHTIFRFADFLARKHGIKHSFVIAGTDEIAFQPDMIRNLFPSLAASECYPIKNHFDDLSHIPDHDLGFCTVWQTAFPLLKFNRVKCKYYFMQEYAPYLYPAGSLSGLAEATYRFGFYGICGSSALRESYEEHGGNAVHFHYGIDRSRFYPSHANGVDREKYRLLFFGSPFDMQGAFEVAAESLRKVKLFFGDKIEIISVDTGWDINELKNVVTRPEKLPTEDRAELYRNSDMALILSMGRHVSPTIYELMASGCLVVSNIRTTNVELLKDRENCLLTETTASCLAQTLTEGLIDRQFRTELARNALRDIEQVGDWDEAFRQAAAFII